MAFSRSQLSQLSFATANSVPFKLFVYNTADTLAMVAAAAYFVLSGTGVTGDGRLNNGNFIFVVASNGAALRAISDAAAGDSLGVALA
jgi:hypothetical protein